MYYHLYFGDLAEKHLRICKKHMKHANTKELFT